MIFSLLNPMSYARLVSGIGKRKTRTQKTETGVSQRATIFWRNTRLEKHRPDDPLNTDPPATPSASPRDIVCGACGCKIARSGEILATGETYKKFLKHEQTLETRDREIERLNAEVTRLNGEVTALNAKLGEGRSSSHRPGSRIQ